MPQIKLVPLNGVPSHGVPRRFVSGMRLECRPVPSWFSSSIHLKIGSTKRRYTEEVYYKTKLVPWRYFEGAAADFCHGPDPASKKYVATMTLQCTYQPIIQLGSQITSSRKSSSSFSSGSSSENETEA